MVVRAGMRLGDWRLVERLGAGAYGEVWRAVHGVLGHEAALKIADGEVAIERLVAGARAQFALDHPNIVRVRDVVASERPAWVVMEAVEGKTLRRILQERGRLEVACAAAVLRQVMDALGHAHARGIVHGDLKPENILVEIAPGAGRAAQWRVRLTDFLVGRPGPRQPAGSALRPSLHTREGIGTLHYMAPEQERSDGRPLDGRVDIYALGVLLFEMLTGSLPQGRDLPSDVNPAISWWWDHVYSRCYTARERRYRSIEAMRADLEAMAHGPAWGELPSQRESVSESLRRPRGPVIDSGALPRLAERRARSRRARVAGLCRPAGHSSRIGTVVGLLLIGGALAGLLRTLESMAPRRLQRGPVRVQAAGAPGSYAETRVLRSWSKGGYRVRVLESGGRRWVCVYRRGESEPLRAVQLSDDDPRWFAGAGR